MSQSESYPQVSVPLSAPSIGPVEIEAVARVMRSGMLAQGPEVEAFEAEFSATVGGAECVAVNSGTSALHLALLSAGIGRGDEVIVPSFTFAATANAVALTGAIPVFADIDPNSFNLCATSAAERVTSRTVAIIPVHLYGQPADMDDIEALANRAGLKVIEDAAQAHLACWRGRPVGSFGTGMFSFYPTKNMTSGEGGMITTRDPELARKARMLRNQGMEVRYQNELVGFNYRMTDIHAAIGRVQLSLLPERTAKRRQIAGRYDRELEGVVTPSVSESAWHVYHQYTIRSGRREQLEAHLRAKGIGAGVYYPTPVHRLPSFSSNDLLPNTESAASEVLSIPVHPSLSEQQVDVVIAAVNSWC